MKSSLFKRPGIGIRIISHFPYHIPDTNTGQDLDKRIDSKTKKRQCLIGCAEKDRYNPFNKVIGDRYYGEQGILINSTQFPQSSDLKTTGSGLVS